MNRLLGMGGYDISIHALREEGDQRHQPCHHAGGISIHALREEGDSPHFFVLVARRVFLSTPSARRATITCSPPSWKAVYFYPRPPRGGRPIPSPALTLPGVFLPTPSARRATGADSSDSISIKVFLPTPSARRATLAKAGIATSDRLFLPTPSARRATWSCASRSTRWSNFYPRPPRGGRPNPPPTAWEARNFYPRPPRGGRLELFLFLHDTRIFLPTPSARRATECFFGAFVHFGISIHALREEGDGVTSCTPESNWYFYPRPPRGGRHCGLCAGAIRQIFLSTPSARRATPRRKAHYPGFLISIHALREEGDPSSRDRLEV